MGSGRAKETPDIEEERARRQNWQTCSQSPGEPRTKSALRNDQRAHRQAAV